jgi:hypothetical protein
MVRFLSLFACALITLVHPCSSAAQWGRRFAVTGGPAIGVQDRPPDGGFHLRGSVALSPRPHLLNLLLDGYATWMPEASEVQVTPAGFVAIWDKETQLGAEMAGLLTFRTQRSISPYVLVGSVYRRSNAGRRVELVDASGRQVTEIDSNTRASQFDILLGVGAAIQSGRRQLLVELRAYGGTVIYLPLTFGVTF